MKEKQKVAVYVISNRGLLIFSHPDHPEVGFQVPAGTVRESEQPQDAAVRELQEESGLLVDATQLELIGTFEHDMRPFREEMQLRHAFLVRLDDQTSDRWAHWERHPDSPEADPVRFEFRWEPLHQFLPDLLSVGQGEPIRHLCGLRASAGTSRLEYRALHEAVQAAAIRRRKSIAEALAVFSPECADELRSSSKSTTMFGALLEHVSYMAMHLGQENKSLLPVDELLRAVVELSASLPRLLVMPRPFCWEIGRHSYETPLFLASAAAVQNAAAVPRPDYLAVLHLLEEFGYAEIVNVCAGIVIELDSKHILEPTNSYTLSGLAGTIYCEYVSSKVRLAETLLHEATHTWLNYAFGALQPNGFSEKEYWSPWRHKLRPPYGILQAAFVFSLLCQFFVKCLGCVEVDARDKAYVESRLRAESRVLHENLGTLSQALAEVEDTGLRMLIAEELNRALNLSPST